MMPLKEQFLSYVELQRNASAVREIYGSTHPKTNEAYQRANNAKRNLMHELEEVDFRITSLEK